MQTSLREYSWGALKLGKWPHHADLSSNPIIALNMISSGMPYSQISGLSLLVSVSVDTSKIQTLDSGPHWQSCPILIPVWCLLPGHLSLEMQQGASACLSSPGTASFPGIVCASLLSLFFQGDESFFWGQENYYYFGSVNHSF